MSGKFHEPFTILVVGSFSFSRNFFFFSLPASKGEASKIFFSRVYVRARLDENYNSLELYFLL